MPARPADLRRIEMLSRLSDRTIAALADAAQEVLAETGQVIEVEGAAAPPVFAVVEGSVRIFKTNMDGRELTLARCGPGSLLYLQSAFGADTRALATSQALVPTKLLKIPQRALLRTASESPELALAALRELSNDQQRAFGLACDLGLLSVRGRLARFVLQNTRGAADVPARWTHEEIAASVGSVREVVSRTLTSFVREGLVKRHRHRIEVLDPEGLEVLIDS